MEKIFEAIGGRKFIMSLVLIAVGTLVELKTDRGVSASFAGLLVGILGTFSAANAFVTKTMGSETESSEEAAPDLTAHIAPIQSDINKISTEAKENAALMSQTLANIGTSVANQNKILAVLMQK